MKGISKVDKLLKTVGLPKGAVAEFIKSHMQSQQDILQNEWVVELFANPLFFGMFRAVGDQFSGEIEIFDLMESFAHPLPSLVIAELLGVPRRDRGRFRAWSSAIVAGGALVVERS